MVITVEDDEEVKLAMVSSNECSSGELLYTSENLTTKESPDVNVIVSEGDNEDKSLPGSEQEFSSGKLIYSSEQPNKDTDKLGTSFVLSSAAEPPLALPSITPPRASTELRRGKHASEM